MKFIRRLWTIGDPLLWQILGAALIFGALVYMFK